MYAFSPIHRQNAGRRKVKLMHFPRFVIQNTMINNITIACTLVIMRIPSISYSTKQIAGRKTSTGTLP